MMAVPVWSKMSTVNAINFAPIQVGSHVFIGVNTIVMPGVKIGSNVVIGAGSVVTKDIPDNSVAIGVPAKVVSSFSDYQDKIKATCASDSELVGITDYAVCSAN